MPGEVLHQSDSSCQRPVKQLERWEEEVCNREYKDILAWIMPNAHKLRVEHANKTPLTLEQSWSDSAEKNHVIAMNIQSVTLVEENKPSW